MYVIYLVLELQRLRDNVQIGFVLLERNVHFKKVIVPIIVDYYMGLAYVTKEHKQLQHFINSTAYSISFSHY